MTQETSQSPALLFDLDGTLIEIVGFEYVGSITCSGARQDNSVGIETTTKAAHSMSLLR
jgi:hypothetical protein